MRGVVGERFGDREKTVWVAFEPRRMHTRKEVTEMYAAITRANLMYLILILAAVGAVLLSVGLQPVEASILRYCPPSC